MTKHTLQRPLASVVVAMGDGSEGMDDCLDALAAQTTPALEVLWVGHGAERVTVRGGGHGSIRTIEANRGALVPALWAAGIEGARGSVVALTALPCRPEPTWLENILAAFESHPDCAAVGGAIDPPMAARASDLAAYFCRYHAFLPPVADGVATDLPGENVAYRRRALAVTWRRSEKGFWETEVHAQMRAQGISLYRSSSIRVRFGAIGPPWRFARIRWRHGRHYGATREATLAVRLARAATAPALPLVLMSRIIRRAARHGLRARLFRALPWLLVFVCAWSLGEAQGYLRGRS